MCVVGHSCCMLCSVVCHGSEHAARARKSAIAACPDTQLQLHGGDTSSEQTWFSLLCCDE